MDKDSKTTAPVKTRDVGQCAYRHNNRHNNGSDDTLSVNRSVEIPPPITDNTVKTDNDGFCGTVQNFQIIDIIQMFCRNEGNIAISVTQDSDHGLIYIKDGEIVHAQCRSLVGKEAFFTILQWPRGIFQTLKPPSIVEPTISAAPEFLLLEAARRTDELIPLQSKIDNVPEPEPVHLEHSPPIAALNDVSSIGDINVDLLFKLGRMKITFQTLKTVRPGTVFSEISTQNSVDVIANGKKIGSGEIVALKNRIGVRLGERNSK